MKWSGSENSYYDEIRTNWESNILKRMEQYGTKFYTMEFIQMIIKFSLSQTDNLNFSLQISKV